MTWCPTATFALVAGDPGTRDLVRLLGGDDLLRAWDELHVTPLDRWADDGGALGLADEP